MLGLTTKHIYFDGRRSGFRVGYDRIVAFDPYEDGFSVMQDTQMAEHQTLRTGDGWSAYNLPSPRVNYQLHSQLLSGPTGQLSRLSPSPPGVAGKTRNGEAMSFIQPETPAIGGLHAVFQRQDTAVFESAAAQWNRAGIDRGTAIAVDGKALQERPRGISRPPT